MFGWIYNRFKGIAQRFGWGRAIALTVLFGFVMLRAWDPVPLELLRLKSFDLYQLLKPRTVTQRPVVIVDIDEPSLEALGQWPWPRTLMAKLVDEVMAKGAVALAFDIVFAEPDRTSPHLIAEALPELSEAARNEMRKAPSHDTILAEALKRSRVVLGQSAYNPRGLKLRKDPVPRAGYATVGGDPRPYLLTFPELLPNIAELERAAKGRGMFSIRPDADGVVRRVPTVLVADDRVVPSLTTELLRVATGQGAFLIKSDANGVRSIVVAGVEVPTDGNGKLWIHYSPHDPQRYVSAKDVIDGTVPAGKLANKLVLVGTSATGLFDLRATPLDPTLPGVEIHAQLLENILAKSTLDRPGYLVGAEVSLAFVVGIATIVLIPILGALRVFALGLSLALIVGSVSWLLFTRQGILFDAAYPLASSFVVFLVLVFVNYLREEAQRQQIRDAFGQYISPALVEQLADNPDRLALGGETKQMTILFSDVREFTSISEQYKRNPQGLTMLMNRFLTPLSDAIMEHRGTIDKYMGDNIMAFWNAPLDDDEHQARACDAALAMVERLERLNVERQSEAAVSGETYIPLDVGVGINTGECVVGNMGSELRFDYSVLGDCVNLASRLEGQSKAYGVTIIVGSSTAEAVGDRFCVLGLDSIRVKGKAEPEDIYTILGRYDRIDAHGYKWLKDAFGEMRAAYRGQDWERAQRILQACRERQNGFGLAALYDVYDTRIRGFRRTPPPPDWDGVFTMDSK
ncbi:MAG: adenylate/guanylate cyclase domain-containing protein [Hyphomicrobiales bacterium]|nr:adenylate/guanylate cyclase domain-containing protein [Hyphomicrobiales bacterium]